MYGQWVLKQRLSTVNFETNGKKSNTENTVKNEKWYSWRILTLEI